MAYALLELISLSFISRWLLSPSFWDFVPGANIFGWPLIIPCSCDASSFPLVKMSWIFSLLTMLQDKWDVSLHLHDGKSSTISAKSTGVQLSHLRVWKWHQWLVTSAYAKFGDPSTWLHGCLFATILGCKCCVEYGRVGSNGGICVSVRWWWWNKASRFSKPCF